MDVWTRRLVQSRAVMRARTPSLLQDPLLQDPLPAPNNKCTAPCEISIIHFVCPYV